VFAINAIWFEQVVSEGVGRDFGVQLLALGGAQEHTIKIILSWPSSARLFVANMGDGQER
jgi:hypothetical protein